MDINTKIELKNKSRLSIGLVNVLHYDIENIHMNISGHDLIHATGAIREAKSTLQKLFGNLTELEYLIYLSEQNE